MLTSEGSSRSSWVKASSPPAEAPIPTIGNDSSLVCALTGTSSLFRWVGPRHTIYLAKNLVEDSTFPFRVDEDLTVRIEGDALVIDKDGRSGRRTTKLDEADSLRDRLVTKTLDVLNFSPLTSKAERINHMLSEIHEAEMLESGVRHMPKNDHGILLWEEESSLDTVLSEFF